MSDLPDIWFPCQSCGKMTTRGVAAWEVSEVYSSDCSSHWANPVLSICGPDCGEMYAVRIALVCPPLIILRISASKTGVGSTETVLRDLRVRPLSKRDAEVMALRYMVGEFSYDRSSVRIVEARPCNRRPCDAQVWTPWEGVQL